MSLDRLKSNVELIRARVAVLAGRGEEATKQALVLPLLDALGYDIWNPTEVSPEFDADFAVRRGSQKERVDLAVLLGGKPRVFVEVKAAGVPLDQHQGQLSRYFNAVPDVCLGILTNGAEYRFFTDTGEPNIMDARPFYTINIESVDVPFDVLARFHKANFSPESIRDFASELIFTSQLVAFLKDEVDLRGREPSESFIRWILGNAAMYEGRVTGSVVERFRPLVRNALQAVLRDIVRRSLVALDQGVGNPPVEPPQTVDAPPSALSSDGHADAEVESARATRGVVTTEEETRAFSIIQEILLRGGISGRTIYDGSLKRAVPVSVEAKDTTGYFGVFLNKPTNWLVRLGLEGKQKWAGFDCDPGELRPLVTGLTELPPTAFARTRYALTTPDDMFVLERVFLHLANRLVDAKRIGDT
jgi:hypothetical protein